ncbi:MAG TPA: O-acetyl-ADP-ribose deacetylase [Chitinophagaceae bacterium]
MKKPVSGAIGTAFLLPNFEIMKASIEVIKGDITGIRADAVVNAANSSLMGGGGVDGAIHRAGGPAILEACKKIIAKQGNCKTGEAVITTAGNLPAQYIIHTVGPIWNGGLKNEAEKLSKCYLNSLLLAEKYNLHTIAFPNISTGMYGFPKNEAAQIAIRITKDFLKQSHVLQKVYFVCFDDENFLLYASLLM